MIINNVTLEEIREEDGAQMYTFPYVDGMSDHLKPPCNVIWLCGWNRASGVKVGDKGRLVYKTDYKSGLYWFEKEQK